MAHPRRLRLATTALAVATLAAAAAFARAPGDPIRMSFIEGDVAGMTTIYSPDGRERIGHVEYRQLRRNDHLHTVRVARFADGSSDEDEADALVGETLRTLGGRSIVRDASGRPVVDLTIDVPAGRVHGFTMTGDERKDFDLDVALPPGTYWGPLIFIVLKNFDANAEDGRVVFRTVAPTPAPRVLDLEIVDSGATEVPRSGGAIATERFQLRPTIHWTIDPLVRLIAPTTRFFVHPGEPPALAAFEGPRNYTGREIRIQ